MFKDCSFSSQILLPQSLYILFAQSCHKIQKVQSAGFGLNEMPHLFKRRQFDRFKKIDSKGMEEDLSCRDKRQKEGFFQIFFWLTLGRACYRNRPLILVFCEGTF